jgi:hypothetical protein
MAAAMAGKKGDALPFQRTDDDGIRGIAKWRLDAEFAGAGQTAHGIKTAAANDANRGMRRFAARTLGLRFFAARHF